MDKVVIADASCLIALDNIDHLYLLQRLFLNIHITEIIADEFGSSLPDWFLIHQISNLKELDLVLDPGEASALTLVLSFENALVIIDEKKGRKVAIELGLTITGTLKILLLAKQKDIIPAIKPVIGLLEAKSFRFSKSIITELLLLANES